VKGELLLALFLLSLLLLVLIKPAEVSLSEVKEYGKLYKVCGTLIPVYELERGCIYRFTDGEGEIKAVAFFGECVSGYACVYGRLEEYRGEPELVILGYA